MGVNLKKVICLTLVLIITLFKINVVNAENFESDFIDINSASYINSSENISLSNVHFTRNDYAFNEIKAFGSVDGRMQNLSNYYIQAYTTIDYYDYNHNIIARSKKTESPSGNNYYMNIILYENDFLGDYNINDIKYYKIKYYTVKGNPINENKTDYNNYNTYDYTIKKYNVDMVVNEDNSIDITEDITAHFNVSKHGIYRQIPLSNTLERTDGTTSKNRAKITNVSVDNKFTKSVENNNLVIRIGDENKTVIGEQNYKIKYKYKLGNDHIKDYDELYYNIIGDSWDTQISNVSFKITMPKEFDASRLGFSKGLKGSTSSDLIKYTVDGNTITGRYEKDLSKGEALTVRCELPEGYFSQASNFTFQTYLIFIIPILGIIVSLILWNKYGNDEEIIETVEFYPPKGFNSLEVGYLYKGVADNKDVTSLLIYLANKGYITISESDKKSLFSKSKEVIIKKVKDYDGKNADEELFLKGLFTKNKSVDITKVYQIMKDAKQNGEKISYLDAYDMALMENSDNEISSVSLTDLRNNFYVTVNKILSNINSKENQSKIFEGNFFKNTFMIILFIFASLFTFIIVPSLDYAGWEELVMSVVVVFFYIPFYAVGIFATNIPKSFRIFWLGFTIFHSFFFFISLPIREAITSERVYLFAFFVNLSSIIIMIIVLKFMPKRTPYGNEMLGKIKGFKTFLETAEKEKLESLVMENPKYFYDILPFTYVLGVSDTWIKKFETISLNKPDWYDGAFTASTFGSFVTSTMASANSSFSSSPSSGSSSGGSSGGGSSGGGSGGGGGGSW